MYILLCVIYYLIPIRSIPKSLVVQIDSAYIQKPKHTICITITQIPYSISY